MFLIARLPLAWRRALIALLALALPLQSMAAAAMLGCAAGAHRAASAAAEMPAGHDHAAMLAAAADAPDRQHAQHADAAHQCSACAACCIGAALPSTALQPPDAAPGHPLQRAAPEPRDASISALPLERPPRFHAA